MPSAKLIHLPEKLQVKIKVEVKLNLKLKSTQKVECIRCARCDYQFNSLVNTVNFSYAILIFIFIFCSCARRDYQFNKSIIGNWPADVPQKNEEKPPACPLLYKKKYK